MYLKTLRYAGVLFVDLPWPAIVGEAGRVGGSVGRGGSSGGGSSAPAMPRSDGACRLLQLGVSGSVGEMENSGLRFGGGFAAATFPSDPPSRLLKFG